MEQTRCMSLILIRACYVGLVGYQAACLCPSQVHFFNCVRCRRGCTHAGGEGLVEGGQTAERCVAGDQTNAGYGAVVSLAAGAAYPRCLTAVNHAKV